MASHPHIRQGDGLYPPDLGDALCDDPKPEAVRNLFAFCHRMATAYVKTKAARGTFQATRLGISSEDFALDAIAELFRQDRGSRLDSFKSLIAKTANPVEPLILHHALRRIIFGAVNQHIFRAFHLSDPTLARLIRNIKETAATTAACRCLRWQETLVIAPRRTELLLDRPFLPDELVRIEFSGHTSRTFSLRQQLSIFVAILCRQSTYKRAYPVTGLALLLRTLLLDSEGESSSPPGDEAISESEIQASIDTVLSEMSRSVLDSYVRTGKLSFEEALAYICALKEILIMTYVHGDAGGASYFTVLSKHLGSMDKREYMQKHRTRFEYIMKKGKDVFQAKWKTELGILQAG